MRFDRSWIPGIATLIVAVIISQNIRRLPFEIGALMAGAIAGWLLWTGVQTLRGRSAGAFLPRSGGPKVQYWRGQRIVVDDKPARRRLSLPPWPQATGAIAAALIGLSGLILLALGFAARFA